MQPTPRRSESMIEIATKSAQSWKSRSNAVGDATWRKSTTSVVVTGCVSGVWTGLGFGYGEVFETTRTVEGTHRNMMVSAQSRAQPTPWAIVGSPCMRELYLRVFYIPTDRKQYLLFPMRRDDLDSDRELCAV